MCSTLGVKFVFLFDLFFFVLPVGVGIFLEERVHEMGKVYGNICRCVIAFLGGPGTTLSSGMGWDLSPGGNQGGAASGWACCRRTGCCRVLLRRVWRSNGRFRNRPAPASRTPEGGRLKAVSVSKSYGAENILHDLNVAVGPGT